MLLVFSLVFSLLKNDIPVGIVLRLFKHLMDLLAVCGIIPFFTHILQHMGWNIPRKYILSLVLIKMVDLYWSLVRFVHNTHMLMLSQIARAIAHTITSTSTMVKIFCQQQEIWIRRDVAPLVWWPGNKHAKDNASLWCDIKRNEDGLLSSSLRSLFIVCTRYMKHIRPFQFTMLPSALEINSCALFRISIPMCWDLSSSLFPTLHVLNATMR